MKPVVQLLKHQMDFVMDVDTDFIALVGGFGCGKTYSATVKGLYLAMLNVGENGMLLSPTHAMAKKVLIPEFKKTLHKYGIPYTYRASPHPNFVLHFAFGDTPVLIESAENHERLVGIELAWFGVDEADTIDRMLAREMWNTLIGRMRAETAPKVQGFATTTPEGFKFIYEFFQKEVEEDPTLIGERRLIRARTYDNPFLSEKYISRMMRSYPKHLQAAYLNGQFVNMSTNGVYPSFTEANIISEDLDAIEYDVNGRVKPRKVLHIGVDFNVANMNAVIFIKDDTNLTAVDEIQLKNDKANTYSLVDAIKYKYPDRKIILYPDATGRNRSTNTVDIENTNHKILRDAGFNLVFGADGNPPIEDRTILINSKILSMDGVITFKVHESCVNLINSLRSRQYKKGMPEKDNVTDHGCDCLDYVSWHLYSKTAMVRQYSASYVKSARQNKRLR